MSKVGLHILLGPRTGYGNLLRQCSDAGSPLALVKVVDDFAPAKEAKDINPKTITIGRIREIDDVFDPNGDIEIQAIRWYDRAYETWNAHRSYIDYWEPLNEISSHWDEQTDFNLELAERAERDGFKLCPFNFSTGNPPQPKDDGGVAYRAIVRCCKALKR